MKLLTLLFLIICTSSFSQKNNIRSLLDIAFTAQSSLFVHSKPLTFTRLDPKEMWYYFENIRDYSSQRLDTAMFSQIIQNAKNADTTIWTDNELTNFLLVNERGETVTKKYPIQKFNLTDKKQIRYFMKHVNRFNSTSKSNRVIYYYSRPVFDNSKTFAIVQWDNAHSYLAGGGGIKLYKLQSDKAWKEFGTILNWRY